MATKIETINDLFRNMSSLPIAAVKDIEKRLTDSLASGGTLEDDYAKQQFRYAENLLNMPKA